MFNKIAGKQKFCFSALIVGLMLWATIGNKPKELLQLGLIQVSAINENPQHSKSGSLDLVKNRGYLICGVNGELPGFSFVNADDRYEGIDVDLCRAIAAALFDDPNRVKFRNLTAEDRFKVLKSGEIDLLSRNTTPTLSRDTDENLEFTPPIFYDAQGIMVKKVGNIKELSELKGKSICVPENTTSYDNLTDYLSQAEIQSQILALADREALFQSYEYDRCQAITGDISQLITRRTLLANPQDHEILSQTISHEPLAPMLLNRDSQWFDVVRWVTFALIQAEELNITSENLNLHKKSKESEIRRFLGIEGKLGSAMGLADDFTMRIIKHVGNYGEIYERNLTQPFGLKRGKNALWRDGGLMYSPPFN